MIALYLYRCFTWSRWSCWGSPLRWSAARPSCGWTLELLEVCPICTPSDSPWFPAIPLSLCHAELSVGQWENLSFSHVVMLCTRSETVKGRNTDCTSTEALLYSSTSDQCYSPTWRLSPLIYWSDTLLHCSICSVSMCGAFFYFHCFHFSKPECDQSEYQHLRDICGSSCFSLHTTPSLTKVNAFLIILSSA